MKATFILMIAQRTEESSAVVMPWLNGARIQMARREDRR